MLTYLVANQWEIYPFADVAFTSGYNEDYGSQLIREFYQYFFVPPSQPYRVTAYSDLDVFISPETIDDLARGRKGFEYKGHTWNDLYHGKVDGTIYNIPFNELEPFLKETPGFVNDANGTRRYAPIILRNQSRKLHTVWHSKSWGYRDVAHHTVYILEFNQRIKTWYVGSYSWYIATKNDGSLVPVDFYGTERDQLSYLPQWNVFRYAPWDSRYATYQRSATMHNPWGTINDRITVTAYTSESTVAHNMIMQTVNDALWRESQPDLNFPGRYYFKISDRNYLSGSSQTLVPKGIDYNVYFPEKERNPNWSDVASQAYQSLGMADINGVANISELLEMGSQVRGFADTLSKIPHSAVKNAAAAWLAVHFGFKLTLLDAIELRHVFEKYAEKRSSLSKCQAAVHYTGLRSTVQYTARYQVFYDEFAQVDSYLRRLQALSDAYLTTENLWDMMPWSFVVDWFVQVGDVLQSLDNYANLTQKHEVICTGRSIKGSQVLLPEQLGLPGTLSYSGLKASLFIRKYQKNLVLPSLTPSVTVNPFNHLIEAAALYISIK